MMLWSKNTCFVVTPLTLDKATSSCQNSPLAVKSLSIYWGLLPSALYPLQATFPFKTTILPSAPASASTKLSAPLTFLPFPSRFSSL